MNVEINQKPLSNAEILTLLALVSLSGKGERYRVINEIGKGSLKVLLSERDLEDLQSGNRTRYAANISWASDKLKKKGYLRKDSPYGLWEITSEGRGQLSEWLAMLQQRKNS